MDPQSAKSRTPSVSFNQLRLFLVLLALAIGLMKLWPWRYTTSPDAISYLDIARNISQGQWKELFNTYWGPLLPSITSIALQIPGIHPFVALHLALAIGWVLCVIAFAVFWSQAQGAAQDGIGRIYPRLWLLVGFALFLILFIPQVPNCTPDIYASAAAFLVATVLLRVGEHGIKLGDGLTLAVAAGIGYWVKSVMYPLGWLAILMFTALAWKKNEWRKAIAAVALFLIIITPLVIGISITAGKFTFGTSGRLNYAWIVDHNSPTISGAYFFNGGRKVFDLPVVYQYATKDDVTFMPWYDPGRADSSKARLNLRGQIRVLTTSAIFLRTLFIRQHGPLLLAVVLLSMFSPKGTAIGLRQRAPVLVFLIAALGIYAFIVLIDRYIVPFEIMVWGAMLGATVINPGSVVERRISRVALVGAVALVLLNEAGNIAVVLGDLHKTQGLDQIRIAETLKRDGLQPDKRVAVMGQALMQGWPHLTRTPIEFEIPVASVESFFQAPAERQEKILSMIHSSGVHFIVNCGPVDPKNGFKQIEGTSCSYLKQ